MTVDEDGDRQKNKHDQREGYQGVTEGVHYCDLLYVCVDKVAFQWTGRFSLSSARMV